MTGARYPLPAPGAVAEWLRSGLQSRLLRFESGRRLQPDGSPPRRHQCSRYGLPMSVGRLSRTGHRVAALRAHARRASPLSMPTSLDRRRRGAAVAESRAAGYEALAVDAQMLLRRGLRGAPPLLRRLPAASTFAVRLRHLRSSCSPRRSGARRRPRSGAEPRLLACFVPAVCRSTASTVAGVAASALSRAGRRFNATGLVCCGRWRLPREHQQAMPPRGVALRNVQYAKTGISYPTHAVG